MPRLYAGLELLCGNAEGDRVRDGVDRDRVAVSDDGDRPADGGLRRDVSHHEAVAAAREAAIRDQADRVPEALADDGACRGEHLAHPRAADRALVADDDDVPGLDAASEDCGERGLLRL